MSTITKIEINQPLFNRLIDLTPVEKLEEVKALVEDANQMVNIIESQVKTTKNFYGNYLSIITSRFTATIFIIAGGNKDGIRAALGINTGDNL